VVVSRPVGCRRCFGTGYSGRIGLFEVLPITKAVKQLITGGATTDEIRDFALAGGMVTLRQDGLRKVLRSLTTFEEVQRVTA